MENGRSNSEVCSIASRPVPTDGGSMDSLQRPVTRCLQMSSKVLQGSRKIMSKVSDGRDLLPFLVVLTRYTLPSPCWSRAESLMAFFSLSSSTSRYLLPTTCTFQSCSMPR